MIGWGTLPLALLTDEAKPKLPVVVRDVQEIVQREVSSAEATSFWTVTYVLMGLRYPPEVVQELLMEVQGMEESSTYQTIIEEGKARGRILAAREFLLKLGSHRLGPPDAAMRAKVEALGDFEQLMALTERAFFVTSWADLFSE